MDRIARASLGFVAGISTAFLAFGLVYAIRMLINCSCLSN